MCGALPLARAEFGRRHTAPAANETSCRRCAPTCTPQGRPTPIRRSDKGGPDPSTPHILGPLLPAAPRHPHAWYCPRSGVPQHHHAGPAWPPPLLLVISAGHLPLRAGRPTRMGSQICRWAPQKGPCRPLELATAAGSPGATTPSPRGTCPPVLLLSIPLN